jgi:transcriptional regulator with XRE-family HTH domain
MRHTELKRWRARRGWTIQQAADRLGISPKTLANYERGRRYLTAGVMTPTAVPQLVALACRALEAAPDEHDYDGSALGGRDASRREAS